MITADEIATAIVAAAKETGASPIDVVEGADRAAGCRVGKQQAISRARAYAARAIDKVFNRPEIVAACPDIARWCGTNRPSWSSFFSSLNQRPLPWWDEATFKRVVDAVMDVPESAPTESPLSPSGAAPCARSTSSRTPIPAAQVKPVADSRHGPPRTGLDRFAEGGGLPASNRAGGEDQLQARERERRECGDLLAEAAANTAKLQAKLPREE